MCAEEPRAITVAWEQLLLNWEGDLQTRSYVKKLPCIQTEAGVSTANHSQSFPFIKV